MRDLGDLPQGFPVVAGSVGPSHGLVYIREIDTPDSVFGLTVHPGELIHDDRHGALIVPEDVGDQLEAAIQKLLSTERIILEAARHPEFDFEAFETAWAAFEIARV